MKTNFTVSELIAIKNPYYDVKDCDYCKCEYSVYLEPLDHSAPLYCKRCGKVITIYNPVTSEEHARHIEERARLEKLSLSLRRIAK